MEKEIPNFNCMRVCTYVCMYGSLSKALIEWFRLFLSVVESKSSPSEDHFKRMYESADKAIHDLKAKGTIYVYVCVYVCVYACMHSCMLWYDV